MQYVKYNNDYILRIDKNEEIVNTIKEFCIKNNIKNGTITGIGNTNKIILSLYDTNQKGYINKTLEEPLEITTLNGNVSTKNNEPYLHIHINVSNKDFQVFGGHLNECYVAATCEITIHKIDGFAKRNFDQETGLNLYDFTIS